MKRLDCARHAPAVSFVAALALVLGVSAADARTLPHRHHAVSSTHDTETASHSRASAKASHSRKAEKKSAGHHLAMTMPTARPLPALPQSNPVVADSGVQLSDPTLSIVAADKPTLADTPTIIRPARHVYCVEFARLASGISLFGDAKTWWNQAHAQYAQISNPAPGAVMVFASRNNMRSGHVAVVKRVVNSRQVLVDHANWGRDGRIYLNAPVVDVSPNNDWSMVKVWNVKANTMGTTAYAIKGFIAQRFAAN